MSNCPDKSLQQDLALRSEDNPADTLNKPFKQTWGFATTALVEYTDQSKGYKIISLILNFVSVCGIIVSLQYGTWWLPLGFAGLLLCNLFYMLHTARVYHERKVNALNSSHRAEITTLSEKHDEAIRQLGEQYNEIEKRLEEEHAKNIRPEIVGEIRDFIIFPILSSGQHDEAAIELVKNIFQPRPIITGSDVTILAYLHNVRSVPTAIKDLQLSIEEDGETFIARYADDGEIYQEQLGGERVRRLLNLKTLDSKRTLTRGEPIEGALRFLVEGHAPKEQHESFSLTLMVTDAFGGEHLIPIGGKPPHPSDRLLAQLEAKEKEKRERINNGLENLINIGRGIEEYKITNTSLYESRKPQWRGTVYQYLQGLGGTYTERFNSSDLESDLTILAEIQKEFRY